MDTNLQQSHGLPYFAGRAARHLKKIQSLRVETPSRSRDSSADRVVDFNVQILRSKGDLRQVVVQDPGRGRSGSCSVIEKAGPSPNCWQQRARQKQ